jgi:hypothetical protein
MAWVMRASGGAAELMFGRGVSASDAGIYEGTWVGDGGDPLAPLRSTMPCGSGVLADGDSLYILPPGHMLEGVYVCHVADEVFASNSLVGLLVAADLELDPAVAYPSFFNKSVDGVMHTTIPTRSQPIEACFHDNLRLDTDGRLTRVPKPREQPFATYGGYVSRLSEALASALANAPAFEPVVTVSSGYDGAAIAVLAAALDCRRAVTIAQGKPVPGVASLDDSGEAVARRLGMEVTVGDRLEYLRRDDLPEAEFLATGFSGEEVVLSSLEGKLADRMLVTAFFGDGMWWLSRPPRPVLWRSDQSGSSLGEWRLRVGFVHVPLPCLGAERYRETQRISRSAEMRPWVMGRRYDKPIARRIIEEAGIPRGTFGEIKRAVSATIHVDGPSALAPATRASLQAFAASEGTSVAFKRRRFPMWRRAALKVSRRLGLEWLAWGFERHKVALGVLEPQFGSLLLHWATSVIRARYSGVGPKPSVDSVDA